MSDMAGEHPAKNFNRGFPSLQQGTTHRSCNVHTWGRSQFTGKAVLNYSQAISQNTWQSPCNWQSELLFYQRFVPIIYGRFPPLPAMSRGCGSWEGVKSLHFSSMISSILCEGSDSMSWKNRRSTSISHGMIWFLFSTLDMDENLEDFFCFLDVAILNLLSIYCRSISHRQLTNLGGFSFTIPT